MIKRKINNNQNNQCQDDLDYIDLNLEKDFKNLSKKNLEDIYTKVLKSLDEIKNKQNEIESNIEITKEKNQMALNEYSTLKNEFTEKKNTTKNLEILIILILELTASSERNSGFTKLNNTSIETRGKSYSKINSLSELVFKNGNDSLTPDCRFLNESDIALVLKNLIENCNDAVIKSMVVKCLDKYNIKLEDIDISICKKSKPNQRYTFFQSLSTTDNSPTQMRENPKKLPLESKSEKSIEGKRQYVYTNEHQNKIKLANGYDLNLNSANLSSPDSMLSTNDCIFGIGNKVIAAIHSKPPTSNIKKKRSEDHRGTDFYACTGDLNLNQKEKDSMFEEVNGLTPFLISSPNMSPPRLKKLDSMTSQSDPHENFRYSASNSINPIFFNNSTYTGGYNNNNINNFINNGIRNVYSNQSKYNPENFFSFCEDNTNSNANFFNKKDN